MMYFSFFWNLRLFFYEMLKCCQNVEKYLASKYVEPSLNHEMVCAVLTERQTSDCDVKCHTLQMGI